MTTERLDPIHEEVREQFVPLLDGELTQDEAHRVREHLAACEDCRAMFTRYRRTLTLVGSLPREQAPIGLTHKVLERIQKKAEHRLREKRLGANGASLPLVAALIVLLAAIVVAVYVFHS